MRKGKEDRREIGEEIIGSTDTQINIMKERQTDRDREREVIVSY